MSGTKGRRRQGIKSRVSRQIGRAIGEWNLIDDGDTILIGLSGGKDSHTLLRQLAERRAFAPIDYTIHVAHIRTRWRCGVTADADFLPGLCRELGHELIVVDTDIRVPDGKTLNCHHCATARRQALFRLAKKLGANKLAFGHHLDDIVETALMNLFFQGALATMVPSLSLFDGALTVIRPLALVTEAEIIEYIQEMAVPTVKGDCPIGHDSQRARMKALVKRLEQDNPHIRQSVFGALRNPKPEYLL